VLTTSPRRTLLLVGLAGAVAGLLLAGPVAAVAFAGYGTLTARALLRRQAGRRADRARRHRLDQLCGLAADLRAGLPVPVVAERLTLGRPGALAPFGRKESAAGDGSDGPDLGRKGAVTGDGPGGSDRLERLARAAVRLADRTGAPLAELLERIEADARSSDRGLAAAAAQAAGARATALLLAALPLGGIGLGYGIGVDPVAVLLHTPVGGACAVVAIALQITGLFWAERLGATPERAT
jgi:tight adherence protein B